MNSRHLLLAAAILLSSTAAYASDVSSDRHAAAQIQRKAVSSTEEARPLDLDVNAAKGAARTARACDCQHE